MQAEKHTIKKLLQSIFGVMSAIIICSCYNTGGRNCERCKSFKYNASKIYSTEYRPIVNIYLENSGSMFGYVNEITEFEESVYSYLSDISLNSTDSMNLFYINSRIIPKQTKLSQTNKIKDFINKLSPTHFIVAGGSLKVSDISDMLKVILDKTDKNTVSVFISDCIFSPGRGIDANTYLINQQIGIKVAFVNKLKKDRMFSLVAYRLNGKFHGKYYNRLDQATAINNVRPFYIILMGNENLVNAITKKNPKEKIKGKGVECAFSINNSSHGVPYEILSSPKIGTFRKCMENPKYHIFDAKKSDKGKNTGKFSFTVGTNFLQLPIDNDYLQNTCNYTLNSKDYELAISQTKKGKYTHLLKFKLKSKVTQPGKCDLKVTLKKQIPQWVNTFNDDEGLDINQNNAMNKTYGIKYLFEGIYEAFVNDGKHDFVELKLFIN